MDVNNVAGIVEGVFGLIVLVAAAVAVARASFAKAQIEALRGDRDDLQARVTILENENERIKLELESEKSKVKVLEGITIGKDHLIIIENLIKQHDKAMGEYLAGIEQLIRDTRAA